MSTRKFEKIRSKDISVCLNNFVTFKRLSFFLYFSIIGMGAFLACMSMPHVLAVHAEPGVYRWDWSYKGL